MAADRHEHLSSSQPLCCPRHKICRWLSASHRAEGSGVTTCWFTEVWSTHTNYRHQRALTTSIWRAMRAIVRDMWKQRESTIQRGESGAAGGAAGELGAALVPSPTPETCLFWSGLKQTLGSHWAKASSQCRWRQKEARGARKCFKGWLGFFFSPLLHSVHRGVEGWGLQIQWEAVGDSDLGKPWSWWCLRSLIKWMYQLLWVIFGGCCQNLFF